ncbi:hypothetical protein ESCO_006561 [Escovopsis weberi]|uniref:NYN domain-containing protein n=1 Tax=Escovopsis weberi TaxID=150374 RepID=A0A0M8N9D1_ESCWE|nr:hypothetical protein ESCO_006561 [Escovopsis weberi]
MTTTTQRGSSKEQPSVLFSYNNGKGYSPIQVYGQVLSRAERHRVLLRRLSLHRAVDDTIAAQFPAISTQGTHVFIDMSNIEINFLQALKFKHMLGDRAYPMPRTHLDLELLTEILVRGRPTVTQSVGCSVVPGRSRPWYVPQLKKLGYHVDLRQRKPVQDPGFSPLCVRYVEDLVDETLQTRIAEAVMEYFDRQGTIVLATGDAKPAEYSAGFFTYVERALRMGWNVELASWKSSLSSTWTSHKWKSQWGNKFRIIELDSYLDLLLANEA